MKLKALALSSIAVCSITAAQTASALTAVVNYTGSLTEVNRPDSLSFIDPLIGTSGGFSGQIAIAGIDQYANFDRDTRMWTFGDDTIDVGSNPGAGFSVISDLIGGFEGVRGFAANPDFDPSLPECSQRELDRAEEGDECFGAVLNDDIVRGVGMDYDELLGSATMEIVAGTLDSFSWSGGIELFSTFDRSFERRDDQFNVIRLTAGSMSIDDFTFDRIDGEFMYFTANATGSITMVEAVPVPAAVWLFGSGLLGLVGVARRKGQSLNA